MIPLLIDGVEMPTEDVLPESLRTLPYLNAINISSEKLDEDLPWLIRSLDRRINDSILELPQILCDRSDDELLRRKQYRHEVRYCLDSNCGQLDRVSQIYLNTLREHLGLSREATRQIEVTAQQAYQRYTDTVDQFTEHRSNELLQASVSQVDAAIRLGRREINHLRRLHHNLDVPRLN
ncbi:MAG TPA: hypothetical protein VLS96_07700, partial [Nodosilinea sp.]|nr:hypothetical protein [Nodosilinea sp.]